MRMLWVLRWVLMTPVASAQPLDLTGHTARFHIGDDPSFAAPDFDDSAWPEQPVIEPRGWQARGAGPFDQVLWQRMKVPHSALAKLSDPALYFDVISGAHAVYVNGVLVGQMSWLDVG